MSHETVNIERTNYDDPFFDQASAKLPKSIKKLLEACQIWALTNSTIAPLVRAAAEYPITALVYSDKDEGVKKTWKDLLEEKVGIYEALFEIGLDYFVYGNCFVTISFPFIRLLKCPTCHQDFPAGTIKYEFRGYEFEGPCPSCKLVVQFKARDEFTPKADGSGIRVVRLEPQLITPKYNRVTGESFYYYDIPRDVIRAVEAGDKEILDGLPIEYIQTVKAKKKFRLLRIFHFKNPTISGRDMQWGFPIMLPSLKDLYLNQVYRKAEEMIGLEYAVPLRVLFPNLTTQDPLQKVSMERFVRFMERSIRFWRRDKNAIITSPVPVSVATIGAPSTYNNAPMRAKILEEAIGGMGFNSDWLTGQARYSAANVSLRIKENQFMSYARRLDRCIKWLCLEIKTFLKLPACAVQMKPFKMADDVQMLQMLFSMAQMNKISWHTIMSRLDLDYGTEKEILLKEARDYGSVQSEAQKALLDATMAQAAAQAEQEVVQGGYKALMLSAQTKSKLEVAEATGSQEMAGEVQSLQRRQQEEEGAYQRKVRGEEAQISRLEADAAKGQASAEESISKVRKRSGGRQQRQQASGPQDPGQEQGQGQNGVTTDAQLETWTRELLGMPANSRKELLGRIQTQSPDIYKAIIEKTQQLAQAENQQEQQQPQDELQAESPKALAEKLMMLPIQKRSQYLVRLRKENPGLFAEVSKILLSTQGSSTSNPKVVVDMRPPSSVHPQRRKNPTI